jgi:disulfide oxidoreductase YuzD
MKKQVWLDDPEEHDFPAAADYLDLTYPAAAVKKMVAKLKKAATVTKKAKDILRAGGLQLLPESNVHVKENIWKVKKGKKLSPILLVRDTRLVIADGYHRLCSIYYLSEDLEVPCRIADKE